MSEAEERAVNRVLSSVAEMFTADGNWKMTDLDGVAELAAMSGFTFPEGANEINDDE